LASPDWLDTVFPSRAQTQAFADTTAALRDGQVCVLITGVSGIGKTTLCRALVNSVDERTFAAAVTDPGLQADEVLARLLRDFGLIADSPRTATHSRRELLSTAGQFLRSLKPLGAHAVIVIDDAERVGADLLHTLHEVSRAADPSGQLLRLVLVGQPSLESRLREPDLQSVGDDITTHVRLQPLNQDEIVPYIVHHRKGTAESVSLGPLTPEQVARIYEHSEGIPSQVNVFAAQPVQSAGEVPFHSTALGSAEEAVEVENPQAASSASGRLVVVLVASLVLAGGGWWWLTRTESRTATAGRPAGSVSVPVVAPPTRPAPASAPAPENETGAAAATSPSLAEPTTTTGVASPVEPIATSAPTSPSAPAALAPAGAITPRPFRITVASFRTAGRADQIAARLQAEKYPVTTRIDRSGTWHQVVVGPFATIEAARDAQRSLEAAGFPDTQITLPPTSPIPVASTPAP
jgi:general secretion pathway protein A